MRSAMRVPTPPRPDSDGGTTSGAPNTHPRRGDRIVARVADLRRRDGRGGDAGDRPAQRPVDARS
ncbi:conserved hypothetical protein [Frankia canadensis]|uniref:Uncharacterized protein n=1 Tax=Frankia canadensis TaxID=1836972 RepID=A0A2I2KUD8_9ACTN|nr:conserved hypothetical protein [Frankia canadensis]SOU56577.1 conserved hypothetical protein [Frankia canadensis]